MRNDLYDAVAAKASLAVLRGYSTSFGTASRLLGKDMERDIAAVYAMVRIADEIVDGEAEHAGLSRDARAQVLDAFEDAVLVAMADGYSTDLLLHAFARTARRVGIGPELVGPFFASMRTDLDPVNLRTERELDDYVHGSAEVVGLMCLHIFVHDRTVDSASMARMEEGAVALGAAFQLVNFLRDLGEDCRELGRRYLPGLDPDSPCESGKQAVLDRIDAEIATAASTLSLLPRRPRMAVQAALGMFAELSRRLRLVPAAELAEVRVRVPDPVKAKILLGAAMAGAR